MIISKMTLKGLITASRSRCRVVFFTPAVIMFSPYSSSLSWAPASDRPAGSEASRASSSPSGKKEKVRRVSSLCSLCWLCLLSALFPSLFTNIIPFPLGFPKKYSQGIKKLSGTYENTPEQQKSPGQRPK